MKRIDSYVTKTEEVQGDPFLSWAKGYSDSTLIDLAKSWRNQSGLDKFYEVLLPAFRYRDRQAARQVLKERGIEYQEPISNKPDYKAEFKDIGNRIKNVFYGLVNLIADGSKF